MKVTATLPDGQVRSMIWINDWRRSLVWEEDPGQRYGVWQGVRHGVCRDSLYGSDAYIAL